MPDETPTEKIERLLIQQIDLSLGISGLIGADQAEAIYNLACAYRELVKAEE